MELPPGPVVLDGCGGLATSLLVAVPGKPVAYSSGLLWLIYGLLYGIVACHFGLLGVPGKYTTKHWRFHSIWYSIYSMRYGGFYSLGSC